MNYSDDIKRLENELTRKKEMQKNLETNCNHDWGNVISDPKPVRKPVFSHYEGNGSDPEPIYTYYDTTEPRWSRTCEKCGKKEYTEKQRPTQFEADFN